MKIYRTIVALLITLPIVGCATKQTQITPAQAQQEQRSVQEYQQDVEERIP